MNKICKRCVMDESSSLFSLDAEGYCNFCTKGLDQIKYIETQGSSFSPEKVEVINRIKEVERNYDGLIGVSGGVDSCYLLHKLVELGLRPLVFHVDAGWNTIQSVENIHNIVSKLGLDLETFIVDWPSMKSIQRSFLQSGVINQDAPQDHAYFAGIYQTAEKFNIKNIFLGSNFATECILPQDWGQPAMDSKNLTMIHGNFSPASRLEFPLMSLWSYVIKVAIFRKFHVHRPLNWIRYSKDEALELLKVKYSFKEYGTKHSESTFTSYYQKVYLPTRFGIDKRKAHISSEIVSGQNTRENGLKTLSEVLPSDIEVRNLRRYVAAKLDFSVDELYELENLPKVDYRNYGYDKYALYALRILDKIRLILKR